MKQALRTALLWGGVLLRPNHGPKVVYYHDVGQTYTAMGTPLRLVLAHVKCLREGDVVCFDDGFRGIWDHREALVRAHVRPKVFIAVSLVGLPGFLTWDEIRLLQNRHGFEFQCHTWSHQTLAGPFIASSPPRKEEDSWFRFELEASKKEIEQQLGRSVTELCFPAGCYNEAILSRCRAAGYVSVYSSDPVGSADGYVKARCIAQGASELAFRAILKGGMWVFASRYRGIHYVG